MRLQVRFMAAIPIGHEVLVQWIEAPAFGSWMPTEPIILDRTTGIVWRAEPLPETFDAATFDIERHDPRRRQHKPMTHGRVKKCIVTTRGATDGYNFQTVLELDPPPAPYR